MYPTAAAIVSLALASRSFAQTTTLNLYVPGADTQPLVASIIASDATATTYALQCVPGTDSSDCGIPGVVTLTEGPATAKYTFPPELDGSGNLAFTGFIDCSLAGTTSAVCVESFGGSEANFPGISTETYIGTEQPYMPVIITAAATSSSSSAGASATRTKTGTVSTATKTSSGGGDGNGGASAKTSPSGSGSGSAQSTSSTASTTSTKVPPAVSTAGVPAVTAGLKWALGGVAAAFVMIR